MPLIAIGVILTCICMSYLCMSHLVEHIDPDITTQCGFTEMVINVPYWLESGCKRMAARLGISTDKFAFSALHTLLMDELIRLAEEGELPAMTPKEFGEVNFYQGGRR